MVKSNSTSRLLSIENLVILTQTDTTVGLISQNSSALANIKDRPDSKPFIRVYSSLNNLKADNKRIPMRQKNLVRRAKKTTFIVNNISFRVAESPLNSQVLRALPWVFSTSANESGKSFERNFCESKADIIIEDQNGLEEQSASKLFKINNKKIKRLR